MPRHPVRVVMRRTGLSADLLRAWEKRYGVVTPGRSESGRRLYSDADVERLQLLYRATLAGRSIGQVASLPAAELAALVRGDARAAGPARVRARPAEAPEAPEAPELHEAASAAHLADALRAVERLDAFELEAVLRRGLVSLSAGALVDTLLVPLLERIGRGWQEGSLRPVHEHVASVVVRRVVDRVLDAAPTSPAAPHLVVATPAGQLHEFGALLGAATAAAEGWRVTYLGASLPAEEIAAAVGSTGADALALSIVYPAGDPAVAHELRRLSALLPPGLPVIVGGAAAPAYRQALAGGDAALLPDLGSLRERLRSLRQQPRAAR